VDKKFLNIPIRTLNDKFVVPYDSKIEKCLLYCDYFICCVTCSVVVLTCFVVCGCVCVCVCVGFVMCVCVWVGFIMCLCVIFVMCVFVWVL
jgi:hypothetical protein